jgi:hypothetical protein
MTTTSPSVRSLRRRGLASGLVLVPGLVLTGCSAVGDAVRDAAHEGAEQVRHSVEDVVGDTLGKVQVSTDGRLPESFPADAVPLAEGKLLGGYAADSDVAGDSTSGYGRFTTDAHTVIVTVSADLGSPVATYVVLPAA